jgi:hypothetical protein
VTAQHVGEKERNLSLNCASGLRFALLRHGERWRDVRPWPTAGLDRRGIISAMTEFLPILEAVAREQKPLLVVAHDVTGEALATLIKNKGTGTLVSCAIALGTGDQARRHQRVLARLSRARVFGDEAGLALSGASVSDLGEVGRVVSTEHRTDGCPTAFTSRTVARWLPRPAPKLSIDDAAAGRVRLVLVLVLVRGSARATRPSAMLEASGNDPARRLAAAMRAAWPRAAIGSTRSRRAARRT